jgi:NDP-sugar pyrophosphorylase family protein
MQAVILAGGKGTRLRPITCTTPKPLISINGKPFLQYQLEFIKSHLTTDILLLVSYLGEKIEDYFGDGAKFNLNLDYSYEKTPLGTAGALKNAENKIKDEFLLFNGDTYLPIDYRKIVDYFHQCKAIGVVVVYGNSGEIASKNIAVNESGLVINYNKNNSKKMTHVDAGITAFKKSMLDFIPKNKICSLEENIFPKLIKQKQLYAFETKQRFYDMGSPQELKLIKGVLK